ncbi:hypothetical protein OQA88_12925 [Cercophora sp. LCS_1]
MSLVTGSGKPCLFEPLPGPHDIRLLYLAPGKTPGALAGTLRRVDLRHCPPYEALSYEWGDPAESHELYLEDGSVASIAKSLHHALQDLRYEEAACRIMWADRICTNHEDQQERQQQASRCWRAQEFTLNKNLIMMCGRLEVPDWELLPHLVQLVVNRELPSTPFILPGYADDPYCMTERLRVTMLLRRCTDPGRGSDHWSLLRLLQLLHPLRTTDPRDKIYSAMGLAAEKDMIQLPVDYSISSERLLIEVAKGIIAPDGRLMLVLSNMQHKTLSLPSWVPD